jgi:hypothetical protein
MGQQSSQSEPYNSHNSSPTTHSEHCFNPMHGEASPRVSPFVFQPSYAVSLPKPQLKEHEILYFCPFYLHDPARCNYRSCFIGRRWSYLCQHLRHRHDAYLCTMCLQYFQDETQWKNHKNTTGYCKKCGMCFLKPKTNGAESPYSSLEHDISCQPNEYFSCRLNDDKWQIVYAQLICDGVHHYPRYEPSVHANADRQVGFNTQPTQPQNLQAGCSPLSVNSGYQSDPMSTSNFQSNSSLEIRGLTDSNRQDIYGNQMSHFQ